MQNVYLNFILAFASNSGYVLNTFIKSFHVYWNTEFVNLDIWNFLILFIVEEIIPLLNCRNLFLDVLMNDQYCLLA